MNDRIVSITFPTCGKCRFAQKPDAKGMYECNGNPPIPLILGTSQDALGRPQLHIEAMVPKVKEDRPACHLYEAKQDFVTAGRS